ncbi:hypothetical protein M0805_007813 [Coniferiporia weirii]|nr:hypothetical protein M0805_007813 [Coniferiporia weirii]
MSTLSPTSSSLASTPAASPSSTPPPGAVNNAPGVPNISRSSSLLFGFLITFLALFVAFMACGYTSRRSGVLMRRRLQEAEELRIQRSATIKPRIWDIWISEGKESWSNMLPLSATIKRPTPITESPPPSEDLHPALHENEPPQEYFPSYIVGGRGIVRVPTASAAPAPAPPESTASNTRTVYDPSYPLVNITASPAWLYDQLRRRRDRGQGSEADRAGGGSGNRGGEAEAEGLQVTVLIAMPCPTRRKGRNAPLSASKLTSGDREISEEDAGAEAEVEEEDRDPQRQDEYEIGVADVRMPPGWDAELDVG